MARLTDPFNEKVRARIFGTTTTTTTSTMSYISTSSSSGSEHDGESISPSPCRLSHLIQNFLEDDFATETTESTREFGSDSDSDELYRPDPTSLINDVINPIIHSNGDQFKSRLLVHASRGSEIFSIFKNKSIFNRNLMAYLREIGYNAGVCKTRWTSSNGGGSGSYEFIDVTTTATSSSSTTRYIIETEFCREFEIARETETFSKVREALPRVFVGKPEELKRIIRVMSEEARRSMRSNGLTLPPWRKSRYMQAKWLGPYKRTTNQLTAPVMTPSPVVKVKCRSVGFDVSSGGPGGGEGLFGVTQATARTR